MIGERCATREEFATKRPMSEPIPLKTAQGIVTITHEIMISINAFGGLALWASLLPDLPLRLLSQGKLVVEEEFDFKF